MAWKIVKYRTCDGSCCVHSPRFPRNPSKPAGSDCIYHENSGDQPYGGCRLYKELLGITRKGKLLQLTTKERKLFDDTCLNWPLPHNDPNSDYDKVYSDEEKEATGLEFGEDICCHRWEEV